MSLEAGAYWREGATPAILLSREHLDQLLPAGKQGRQFLTLDIRQGSWLGPHCLSKMGEDRRVQTVGFGQASATVAKYRT
jgi:hypothetical protein